MNVSFNRIILFVQNVDKLKQFYQKHFNFGLTEEIKNEWAVVKAGSMEIAFHKIGASYKPGDNKPFHIDTNVKLVFEIDGDIAAFRKELIKNNVAMKDIKSFDGYDFLLCDGEDFEGNIFQLKQKIHN